MIGSHNTLSYLPVKKWWMKLLTPWHKCQYDSAVVQTVFDNVEYLDIRVRFIDGEPVFVYNNTVYETPISPLDHLVNIARLSILSLRHFDEEKWKDRKIPFRLILDVRKVPENYIQQLKLFVSLIGKLQHEPYCSYLELDEARIYWDWDNPLIKSKYDIREIHTSVCSKWYQYILGTKWFAKRYNKDVYKLNSNTKDKNTVYLIDYVDIRI